MTKRILLLSGTSEGPRLARALHEAGFAVHATVTRPEACATLFGALPHAVVEARGFTEQGLADFLAGGSADLVLDATHPFAVRITRIAQAVCARLSTPYVRYERPDWEPPPGTHFADSYAAAAERLPSLGARAMLTLGSKQLKHFAHLHACMTLFARVLPTPVSLQQALDAGFTGNRVQGLRPPFSIELNQALFREYDVHVLVSKASGVEGGVVEKVTAARALGMAVLMIRRPLVEGLAAASTVEDAVRACLEKTGE